MTVTWEPVALGSARERPASKPAPPPLLPLEPGEQYRFTFDMGACIGCHSCEVACAEQNDTAVDEPWRRVGEVESGDYPATRRFSLSMACNHCVEPTCLSGCPTNAYEKLSNGLVVHHSEECVGCQYCMWNCPYEVPVFNTSTRVVSKCDMCRPRLEQGQEPACVQACPTRALGVEAVNVEDWRADHASADAPGLPPADITLSTTAIVVPDGMSGEVRTGDGHRVELEDPHWPLVVLTLLTQLSLGTLASTVVLDLVGGVGAAGNLGGGAAAAAAAGLVALGASLFHLGRPDRALKALRNLATSWLSREVALFGVFSLASLVYAAASLMGLSPWPRLGVGLAAGLAGTAGVYASARLYLVPARPAWNSARTPVAFYATALAAGPVLGLLCIDRASAGPGLVVALVVAAAVGVAVQVGVHLHLRRGVSRAADRQYRGTAQLLGRLRDLVLLRGLLWAITLVMLGSTLAVDPASPAAGGRLLAALVSISGAELIGRYLFYVTVVPFRVAGSFFAGASR